MDKLIVSGPGFPGTNEYLEFTHSAAYYPLKFLAKMVGDLAIISSQQGLVYEQHPFSYYLTYDGEIWPYIGALPSITGSIVLIEEEHQMMYDTTGTGNFNDSQPVWKKRYAKAGTLAEPNAIYAIQYAAFKQVNPKTIMQMSKYKKLKGSVIVSNNTTAGFSGVATGDMASVQLYNGVQSALYPFIIVTMDESLDPTLVPNIQLRPNGSQRRPVIHHVNNQQIVIGLAGLTINSSSPIPQNMNFPQMEILIECIQM